MFWNTTKYLFVAYKGQINQNQITESCAFFKGKNLTFKYLEDEITRMNEEKGTKVQNLTLTALTPIPKSLYKSLTSNMG